MAAITIEDIRKKYPQYNDLSDVDLAKGIYNRYYSDLPFEDFASRIGLTLAPAPKEPEKDRYPTLAAAADVPLSFGRGLTTGVKMISDFFGADNPVSQNLQSVDTYLADLMSAQSKKDAQEVSRIMAEAQDNGVWEQVKAGIKAFSVAPVDILTNAFGTAAPTIVAGLAATALAPAAAPVAGVLTAGRLAAGAVGAISGAGTIKGTIYNDVKAALREQGVPDDVAEETAVRAQSYNGENLDNILAGGVLGTIASVTGLEPVAVKGFLSRIITGSAAKEAAEATVQRTGAGAIARGAAAEMIPEGLQAGQEKFASNVAQQREGMDVPTFRGVAGAAALEGVVGGILGGVAKGLETPSVRTPKKQDEDAALKDALDVFNQNQKAKGLGPILQIEDMTGNRILAFASQNRENIPVLGQILDSGIPRDIKIEQIKKRLSELPQYAAPTQTAIEGRVALPSPPEPGTLTSAAEAFATAMKSNVPMTNLNVSQGPEGYRVVNDSGEVITQQVKTEREANVLMEALRREQDARQTGIYQQDVKAYEQERLPVITEAVARAAREVQTPITGYPMKDVKAVDEGLYTAIREARKGKRLTADVTPEEIARLNPSPAVMNELNVKQKPVTGGGAAIRPEYETEILGPRPLAPFATARSAEQLRQSTEKTPGKIKVPGQRKLQNVMFAPSLAGAEVTQTQPLSQFEQPKMVTLYRGEGMADIGGMERWTTDKESARRFGRLRQVTLPQDVVYRNSAAYAGAPKTDVLFDKRGRTPMEIAKQMPVTQGDVTQEYSAVPEEDMARAPKAAAKPAKKKREVIQNVLKPEVGEAPPAGFRPAEGKQQRQVRETYPEVAPEKAPPTAEAVAEAEKVINSRIDRVSNHGEQGKKIAEGLRTALESGDFTPEQMLVAFKMSDISARLLGTTAAAPHDFKFFNAIINSKTGTRSYGVRDFGEGAVKLATVPQVLSKGRNTAAHEAFHVLQDLFNEYDKPSARIIRDAFRGALTVDNISPELLRKLKSITEPESGKTYYEVVKENFGNLYKNESPQKRERELQAYVFEALEDARSKGVSVQSFGGAFTRLLNFISDFKSRLRNYLAGQGYRNAADVFERIGTGEQQRGLGVSTERPGAKIIQRGRYEPEDLSRAAEQVGENVAEFKKWWKESKAVDENGNPKRYYHGTRAVFRRFKGGAAYFFSPNPEFANKFAYTPDEDPNVNMIMAGTMFGKDANVLPVYLSVQDPFDYENSQHINRLLKETQLYINEIQDIRRGDWEAIESDEVQNALRLAGFDGFYVRERGQKNLAVYEPSQIKSVFNRFEPGTAVSEDFSRADMPLRDKVPGLKAIWPHLTQDERDSLVTSSAKNLVENFRKLPSPEEIASVAYSGRAKRGWYVNSARAIVKIFGAVDSRRFAALLAATSPQTSVESNLVNTLNIWTNWVRAGRPTDSASILRIMGDSVQGNKGEESILDAWKNNSLRALSTPDSELNNLEISGPKVNSFMKNLLGVVEEVTNDAWMANYSGVKQEVFKGRKTGEDTFGNIYTKSSGYISMSAAARKAAAILTQKTGNTWTPSEIQETVWSWAKALYEMRAAAGEGRTARNILLQGDLTGDVINSVPDFERLFIEGVYRQILEGSGYGKQIRELGRTVAGRETGAAGTGTGINALEYEGSGFTEDAFRRNLLRAAKRIEQLYQTRLSERGVTEDLSIVTEDISEATVEDINATGQGPAVEANSNTYTKTWDKVREFFNPFALVTNQPMLFQLRNKMYGKIDITQRAARETSDVIANANTADRQATYKFLTTRNADPMTIVDPKVRAAAQRAKAAINKMGQELVDEKFMTQESYDTFYDQYLPRIYLYYELTNRGMTTPLGGVSKMEYLKKRDQDLTKEERDLLGEIKDPAFLTYVAMARPARDLAMAEYLKNISVYSGVGDQGKPWVLKESTVDWNGVKISPYALLSEAEDIRKHVLPVAQEHDPEQARSILANVNRMEKIAREGLKDIGVAERTFDRNLYAQMPKNKRYGVLAGAIIQKGIYDDLVGTFIPFKVDNESLLSRVFGDENSALAKGVGLWKLGKTTLNIPTQFRNAVSNMIALTLFTDVSILRLPGLFKRAATEIINNSQNWKDAQEFGIRGGTMSSAELRGIFERTLQRINKYDGSKKDNPLIKAYAMTRIFSTAVEKAGDIYQASEVLFKFMAFLNERQKQNFGRKPSLISDAVNVANDALFDYTLVNPNIRWVRNAPIGLPFITYFYKVAPKLIETAYKHPMRFAPYIALATALPLYTMAELDLTPDELESMRKTLPEYIRNNGSLYFLPYRDENGNIAYVDLAPFFPWSSLVDPLLKMYQGDIKGGAGDVLNPIQPGGPIVAAIAVASTGVDPFTKKPVMDPRDTPTAQGLSLVSYIWNQAMPPMFSINLNDTDQSAGALPRIYNSMFVDGTGTDKRGLPRPDATLTAARLVGFNATPLKADLQRASNMNYMLGQIRRRESYRAEIAKDQSMTQEKRLKKIQAVNDQIREDYQKLQEYGQETAAAAGVANRLRQSGKEEQ